MKTKQPDAGFSLVKRQAQAENTDLSRHNQQEAAQ